MEPGNVRFPAPTITPFTPVFQRCSSMDKNLDQPQKSLTASGRFPCDPILSPARDLYIDLKTEIQKKTKNDGLENRSPFKYGFWVSGVYQKKDANVLEFHHSQLKCSNSLAFPLFLTGMLSSSKLP